MATTTTTGLAKLSDGFGVVTVMNVRLYTLKDGKSYVGNAAGLVAGDFDKTDIYLDTLKIANMSMEGPTKTITGGQYSNPLIKYGKTMTMEMQDALGRTSVMEKFFGCELTGSDGSKVLSVGDKFPGAFAMEGDTFFIDQATGDKETVHIFIPQFLPDGLFNLVQDAEGDATVFDLNGSVSVTKIKEGEATKDVFYQIRDTAFFASINEQ